LFNDQLKGNWDEYLTTLENATPAIRALAITDYYLLDTYRAVIEQKSKGRLPGCDLIFPDIGLRFSVGRAILCAKSKCQHF
jgi:hypothetical protein